MRGFIILLLCICFCDGAKAQLIGDEKAIINLVTQPAPEKPDFCSEEAGFPTWLIPQVNLYFKTDTILHLSVNEKNELFKKLKATEHVSKWNQSNTNHIKLYNNKINAVYLVDTLHYDSIKKKWSNIHIFHFLQFSKPVFIRNNSICFVYRHFFQTCFYDPIFHIHECPATDAVNMYVKTNGVWSYKTWIFMTIAD